MASVAAVLRYLANSSRRPRADSKNPTRTVMPTVEVPVTAFDLRAASPPPSLAEEGFTLVAHQSAVGDFGNADQLETIYLPEVEELVRIATGAREAWALPRPVLRSESHAPAPANEVVRDVTAPVVHADYSPRAIPDLVAAAQGRRRGSAPSWGRFALYTVWRSLRPPPQDRPLALCDLRTVERGDLVPADAIGNPGALADTAEFLLVLPNPRHRWCYFADMRPDEALIFQQLDSASDAPSGCPHTSFELGASEATLPRLSVEARVCAFFDR